MDYCKRWLKAEDMASYVGVGVPALKGYVKKGRLPEPSYQLGPRSPRWDRLAVDEAFLGAPKRSVSIGETLVAGILARATKRFVPQPDLCETALGRPLRIKATKKVGSE